MISHALLGRITPPSQHGTLWRIMLQHARQSASRSWAGLTASNCSGDIYARLPPKYAAGEAPIVAADGRSLARALRVAGKLEPVFVDEINLLKG